jgi:signal recognition particle subunit SRP54
MLGMGGERPDALKQMAEKLPGGLSGGLPEKFPGCL